MRTHGEVWDASQTELSSRRSGLDRWPDLRAIVGCCLLAAPVVAIDGYFSAQEGYLSRPADYDGAGYMVFARTVYQLLHGFHLHSALVHLMTIAPGWTAALAFQYLVLGA